MWSGVEFIEYESSESKSPGLGQILTLIGPLRPGFSDHFTAPFTFPESNRGSVPDFEDSIQL